MYFAKYICALDTRVGLFKWRTEFNILWKTFRSEYFSSFTGNKASFAIFKPASSRWRLCFTFTLKIYINVFFVIKKSGFSLKCLQTNVTFTAVNQCHCRNLRVWSIICHGSQTMVRGSLVVLKPPLIWFPLGCDWSDRWYLERCIFSKVVTFFLGGGC